jgi:hypothetical protein
MTSSAARRWNASRPGIKDKHHTRKHRTKVTLVWNRSLALGDSGYRPAGGRERSSAAWSGGHYVPTSVRAMRSVITSSSAISRLDRPRDPDKHRTLPFGQCVKTAARRADLLNQPTGDGRVEVGAAAVGQLAELIDRLLAVGRLGRHRHVVKRLQVGADAAPHHGVVVDDHHLDRLSLTACPPAPGGSARIATR